MKNKEKYAEDIIALAIRGFNIACYKKTKELVACETLDCEKCMFNSDGNCTAFRRSWFESEVELTVEDELKSELEAVKKERDELRERLNKAIGLPYMYEAEVVDSAGHFLKTIYVVVYNNNGTIQAIQYSYKKVAEAKLKALQGRRSE